MHFRPLVLLVFIAGFFGSASAADDSKVRRYAEIRIASDDKIQVLICANVWRGFFTVHGFGGYSQNVYFWSTLHGQGPEYLDPVLLVNGLSSEQFAHTGKIVVDKKKKEVTVVLQRIVSKPGEPLRTEPSPANGIYPIKKTSTDELLQDSRREPNQAPEPTGPSARGSS